MQGVVLTLPQRERMHVFRSLASIDSVIFFGGGGKEECDRTWHAR